MFRICFEVPPIHIDVHLHSDQSSGGGDLKAMLVQIAQSISQLKEIIMATEAEYEASFARVDVATTGIANLIRTLIDRPLGGMTAAQEDTFKARLESLAGVLEVMAVTPTDPVPVPVPEPEPTP